METTPLDEAFERAGGQSALASKLKKSPQAVQQWHRVPSGQVLAVALAIGYAVTPHQLRPDLYPHPDDGLPARLRRMAARSRQ